MIYDSMITLSVAILAQVFKFFLNRGYCATTQHLVLESVAMPKVRRRKTKKSAETPDSTKKTRPKASPERSQEPSEKNTKRKRRNDTCSECGYEILVDEARYQTRNCHQRCGLLRRKADHTLRGNDNEKTQLDLLRKSKDKSNYQGVLACLNTDASSRLTKNKKAQFLTQIAASTVRKQNIESEDGYLLLNKDNYVDHYSGRGKTDKQLKKQFDKDLKTKKTVEHDNEKCIVLRLPPKVTKKDILEKKLTFDGDHKSKAGQLAVEALTKGHLTRGPVSELGLSLGESSDDDEDEDEEGESSSNSSSNSDDDSVDSDSLQKISESDGSPKSDDDSDDDCGNDKDQKVSTVRGVFNAKDIKKARKVKGRITHTPDDASRSDVPEHQKKLQGIIGFEGIVSTKLESFKIAGKPADVAVNAMFDKVRHDDRVAELNIPKVIADALNAYEKLAAVKAQISKWKHAEYDKRRNEGEAIVKEFDDAFRCLLDFHGTLRIVAEKTKEGQDSSKRKIGNRRKGLKARFEDGKFPEAFATRIADVVTNMTDGCRNLKELFHSAPYDMEYKGQTEDAFGKALTFRNVIRSVGADKECSASSSECAVPPTLLINCANFYENNKTVARDIIEQGSTQLNKNERTHGVILFPATQTLDWSPLAKENPDEGDYKSLDPVLAIQSCWAHNMALEQTPLIGCAGFLTVFAEYAVITLIDLDLFEGDLCTVDAMSSKVLSQPDNMSLLQKTPIVGIPPGSTVFVPHGYIAIPIFIDKTKRGDDVGWGAYSFLPITGTKVTRELNAHATAEFKSAYEKRLAMQTKTAKHFATEIKNLSDCLLPPRVETSSALAKPKDQADGPF